MPGSINTRYGPGGVTTETETGFSGGIPGVNIPSASGIQLPGMPDLSGAMNARLAIEAERERRAAQLHALQLRAMREGMRASRPDSNRFTSNEGRATSQMNAMAGDPVFLRSATGFNSSGGYQRASFGDQGAAFAGFAPPGSRPNNAILQQGLREEEDDAPFDPYRTQRADLNRVNASSGRR